MGLWFLHLIFGGSLQLLLSHPEELPLRVLLHHPSCSQLFLLISVSVKLQHCVLLPVVRRAIHLVWSVNVTLTLTTAPFTVPFPCTGIADIPRDSSRHLHLRSKTSRLAPNLTRCKAPRSSQKHTPCSRRITGSTQSRLFFTFFMQRDLTLSQTLPHILHRGAELSHIYEIKHISGSKEWIRGEFNVHSLQSISRVVFHLVV